MLEDHVEHLVGQTEKIRLLIKDRGMVASARDYSEEGG